MEKEDHLKKKIKKLFIFKKNKSGEDKDSG